MVEKSKDGTLKAVSSNGDAKAAPKKRGRWDMKEDAGEETPAKRKATELTPNSADKMGSLWDKEDVS